LATPNFREFDTMTKLRWKNILTAIVALATFAVGASAQVTTGSIAGRVTGPGGNPVAGVRVTATHVPSGTAYNALTRADGRYTIPAARVGAPYTVTFRAIGFAAITKDNLAVDLGVRLDLDVEVQQTAVKLSTVAITTEAGAISSTRTGAATKIGKEAIEAFPTIGRTLTDFTRLTPQASGSSFAGQDNRFNNISIDGASFNNSFGLAGQPGGRTGVAPIPIEAIDQIQVAIAPYDVRQGNFVGAGVNAVTRSGTNKFQGSLYNIRRDQSLVGTQINGNPFNPGVFKYNLLGGWASGPIIKDRLFFFVSYEDDKATNPSTTFIPNTGGPTTGGNNTRVLDSDLSAMQSFMSSKFNYNTGPYTGYSNLTPSTRSLYKIDLNINSRNKLSFRYNELKSSSDQLISNSNSLGFGNRRTNNLSFSFQNSGYAILENIKSGVVELNSQITDNIANNLIIGKTSNDESRKAAPLFPTIDILNAGSTYMSLGEDPFTPSNQLRYKTFQVQDNISFYTDKHDFTVGVTYQKYHSDNVFYQGSNSVYVYNTLADFYTDANDYLANPKRTTSPITLARFQLGYVNIPGISEPLQSLDVQYYGAYAQDEWRAAKNLKVTYGVRFDIPDFKNTAYENTQSAGYTFRNGAGQAVQYSTKTMPKASPLWSPRVGFNWDVSGDRSTQVRGGTGVFTGSPAFVWISNQIGNNGVLLGAIDASNTKAYPFNPDPKGYFPTGLTGAPAPSYTLNFTEPSFKFPQIWRSNLAIDKKLPMGFTGTVELLYSKNVNAAAYENVNLAAPLGNFAGADKRPRWSTASNANRVYPNVVGAYLLKNTSDGDSYTYSVSLEKAFQNGFFTKFAYNYGQARGNFDPGSIAQGNWTSNAQNGNPNTPGTGFSSFSPGHRAFAALSYAHDFFKFGTTTISTFLEMYEPGNYSYQFASDANGDGANNDLLYIPKNTSEMNFQQFTASGKTFTAQDQATAWDAFISQDPYLKKHRGEYAQKGAAWVPFLIRDDLSISQNIFTGIGGTKNALEVRLDILNFGNMINNRWGVSQFAQSTSPLTNPSVDANGALTYRLRAFGTSLINSTWQSNGGLSDTYRMQLGFRYRFN
jgi:outer membrane receptor protein involved in Fe transport